MTISLARLTERGSSGRQVRIIDNVYFLLHISPNRCVSEIALYDQRLLLEVETALSDLFCHFLRFTKHKTSNVANVFKF